MAAFAVRNRFNIYTNPSLTICTTYSTTTDMEALMALELPVRKSLDNQTTAVNDLLMELIVRESVWIVNALWLYKYVLSSGYIYSVMIRFLVSKHYTYLRANYMYKLSIWLRFFLLFGIYEPICSFYFCWKT